MLSAYRAFGRLAVIALAATALAAPVSAACGDQDRVRCLPQFEMLNAVARSDGQFMAAGLVRRDGSVQPAMARLSRTGDVTSMISLPSPGGRPLGPKGVADPRRLIALPKGGYILIGQAPLPDDVTTIGWAMRIAENGAVLWNRPIEDGAHSVLLHSVHYDAATDRVMLVGRLTQGSDDGQCTKWSQSLVVTLRAQDGVQTAPRFTRGDQARADTNRQAIYDIQPGERPGQFVVTGFMTVPTSRPGRRCLDMAFVGLLAPAGQGWSLATLGRVGARETGEVAFSIKPAGAAGSYVIAGQRRDAQADAPAAQAYLIKASPFAVLQSLTAPYPADGSDKTGGDRFRIALPLPDGRGILLAGSVSTSDKALNRAMLRVASPNLQGGDAPTVMSAAGSDILDAALGPDGTALAVGRWIDTDGKRVGFAHVVGDQPLRGEQAVRGVPATRPPPPEIRAVDLATLPLVEGVHRVPPAALAAGAAYAGKALAAGAQVDLAFTLDGPRTIRMSAGSESGDVDLVLSDGANRLLAFSNFRRSATELLIAALPAGEYRLSVLAQAAAPAYQVRLGPSPELPDEALGLLQVLSPKDRAELAETLAAGGYSVSPEPGISLGSETARSLLAAQQAAGARRAVGPGGVGRFLAGALERR